MRLLPVEMERSKQYYWLPNFVRNSLPMRSSLDVGGKAWVLKAEIGGGDDESDKEGDDDGLNRQRCEVLSIP